MIRNWAEIVSASRDQKVFVKEVHDILGLPEAVGSLQQCLAEISKQSKSSPKPQNELSTDMAQQAVAHFRNLFELRDASSVLPRMNDLFVFCAEVEDGNFMLSRFNQAQRYVGH